MTISRPVFITLPPLDIVDYARYLRDRGWRLESDETMEFELLCFPLDAAATGSGWKLRDAVIFQSERDLRSHFDYLFATHYAIPTGPPTEDTDAEHTPGQPG